MSIIRKVFACSALLLMIPTVARAHELHGSGGFLSGLSHPVLGLDHLLAMISVGVLSAQIGGRAIWSVPLTFVSVMLVGGVWGIAQIPLPFVERGIAVSLIALGAAVAAERNLPTVYAMYFVGLFAIFHGHAHGTEMPSLARPVLYALGFVLGTAGIHIAGVLFGVVALRFKRTGMRLLRLSGLGITGMGFYFLLG